MTRNFPTKSSLLKKNGIPRKGDEFIIHHEECTPLFNMGVGNIVEDTSNTHAKQWRALLMVDDELITFSNEKADDNPVSTVSFLHSTNLRSSINIKIRSAGSIDDVEVNPRHRRYS